MINISSSKEMINILKALNKIGALGSKIVHGTYFPDSYSVDDILCLKFDPYKYFKDIAAISVIYDNRKQQNEKFSQLYGKNHIQVSLTTFYDIECGDIPSKIVLYENMIEETLKLMIIK